MAILTSYEGSNDDYENGGTGQKRAQSFQLLADSTVEGISFYGSRGYNAGPGTFQVRISSGSEPDATLIYSETFNTSVLSSAGNLTWNNLTFSTAQELDANTTYYLEIRALTGSSNDEIRWSLDNTSPSYAYGSRWYNGGSSWTETTGSDYNFRILGYTSNEYNKALTATAQASASFLKGAKLTKSVTAQATASFTREVARIISVVSQATTSVVKSVTKELNVTAQASALLIAGLLYAKELVITAKATATFLKTKLKFVALIATAQASATIEKLKLFLKDITATAQVNASLVTFKTLTKTLTATAQTTALLIQSGISLSRELVVTASATVTNTMQKVLSKTLIATGRAIVSVLRDYGYIDKYPRNQVNYEDKYPE